MFRTRGFKGYAVEFSPYYEFKLACASAANYGIVGNGRLWILDTAHGSTIYAERGYDTQDGLYDCAWSEHHENQIASCSGDGSVKLWDITLAGNPIRHWLEHSREVFSINWNQVSRETFATASWDHTVKIWHPESKRSLRTFDEHFHCVYAAIWSPHNASLLASASGDQTIKIWDMNAPNSIQTIKAHDNEILSVDWMKYKPGCIVTTGVDNTIRGWDLRNTRMELFKFNAHDYAVRRIKTSSFSPDMIATTSYDMTMKIWNTSIIPPQVVHIHQQHSEFVFGLDFSLFTPGLMATCGWDEMVHLIRCLAL